MMRVILNEITNPRFYGKLSIEDFERTLKEWHLIFPKEEKIKIDYSYINSIQSVKGKAKSPLVGNLPFFLFPIFSIKLLNLE